MTTPGSGRLRYWLVLAALVAAGVWPYAGGLGDYPMTADGWMWLERGDPAKEGWLDWVLHTRHFKVGYRPVAAASYSATLAVFGPSPWALRATDLALHAAAAVLVAVLARRLAPELPRWTALLACALFLVHPAGEEVVPYLARRNYSLSLAAVLTALVLLARPVPAGWARSGLAGVAVAAALLSNELAVLGALALGPLVWSATRGAPPGRRARALLGPLLVGGAALIWRQSVVGDLGGYEPDADGRASALRAVSRAGRALVGVEPAGWGLALVLVVCAAHVAAAVAGGRRGAARSIGLALWVLGGVATFAALGVWFGRLAYALLPAWALLVALHLGQTLASRRGPARVALAALLALSPLPALARSPVLIGPDPDRIEKRARRQELVEAILSTADGLEPPARLALVLPFQRVATGALVDLEQGRPRERDRPRLPREARVPFRLVSWLRADSAVRIEELAYVEEDGHAWADPTLLGEVDGTPAIVAPEGRRLFVQGRPRKRPASGAENVQLLVRRPGDRTPTWVFLYRPGGGEVVALGD